MSELVMNGHSWKESLSGDVGIRIGILCFGTWLHAANSMLAATTLPSAIREIGGGHLIAWAFALYLLGSILAGAGAGLLARRFDVRFGMILAAGFYALGCVICAMAPDMTILLGGRLMQGIGGGFLLALTFVSLHRWFDADILPKIMALLSAVWSASAFCGPLVGGTFSMFGLWRYAFWVFAAQAILFVVLAKIFMPSEVRVDQNSRTEFPALRLLLLSISILSVAWAGAEIDRYMSPALCILATILIWYVFRLDAKNPQNRMFPSRPMSFGSPVGAGLAFALWSSFATMSLLVFGPTLLETLHGLTPLTAGYLVALESIAWGTAAVIVAGRPESAEKRLIRIGASLVTVGIAGFALAMPSGPVWALVLCALISGAGFGMMWAFVVKRVVTNALSQEKDVASSALPTMKQIGLAFGAAAAGIVANTAGFADGVTVETARIAAFWLFAAFLPFALWSNIAAWKLSRD